MIKNYICIRDCSYKFKSPMQQGGMPNFTFSYNFCQGSIYMINPTYILGDKDEEHKIFKDSRNLIFGFASTKFIYRNFIREEDYCDMDAIYDVLLEHGNKLTDEEVSKIKFELNKNSRN